MTDISAYVQEVIASRRKLHMNPEEGWTEFQTMYHVVSTLRSYGLEPKFGIEVINPEAVMGRSEAKVEASIEKALAAGVPAEFIERSGKYTGVVVDIDTGRPGPTVAFRVDMDCVLVGETTDPEHVPNKLGFASCNPGLMHSCGHDAHTSVGLGLAHWAVDNRDSLCGKIRILFQPAEEGTRGAAAMAAAGVVDDCDWLFGSHIGTFCASREVGISKGGFLATTKMDIEFTGTPSHAGADPHKGRSALMAAAACALMLQGIPRHGEGASRIAVGTLHAGEGRNVTPVHASLQIEVRGETHEINQYMTERVYKIVEGIKESYEVDGRAIKAGEATTLVVNEEACDLVESVARESNLVKSIEFLTKPTGSEDFTILMRRAADHGAKTAFLLYGCDHHGHHRADFEIQDEINLPVGLQVLTGIAQKICAA